MNQAPRASHRWGWVALISWCTASVAAAQPGVVQDGVCQPLGAIVIAMCRAGSGCAIADGPTGRCVELGERSYCIPDGAVLCCAENADCPSDEPAGGRCVPLPSLGLGVCLERRDYCGSPPSAEQVLACHRVGTELRPWALGDCDRDGIPNAVELAQMTDPCRAPEPQAIFDPETESCLQLSTRCMPETRCQIGDRREGRCVLADDGAGLRCTVRDEADELFCGGPEHTCPAGQIEVRVEGLSSAACSPNYCPSDDGPLPPSCVRDPEDGALTAPGRGDCDLDGVTNDDDETPCGGSEPALDAGAPRLDGGAVDGAAGTMDAGSSVATPRFAGGGGCVCRTAPTRGGGGALLVALALAGAWLGRRPRRSSS